MSTTRNPEPVADSLDAWHAQKLRHEAELERARRRPEKCEACGEGVPAFRVSVTDLDGVVLDVSVLCEDCIEPVKDALA
jgi:hypothetical protein